MELYSLKKNSWRPQTRTPEHFPLFQNKVETLDRHQLLYSSTDWFLTLGTRLTWSPNMPKGPETKKSNNSMRKCRLLSKRFKTRGRYSRREITRRMLYLNAICIKNFLFLFFFYFLLRSEKCLKERKRRNLTKESNMRLDWWK